MSNQRKPIPANTYDDPSLYDTRMPTSSRRYPVPGTNTTVAPGGLYTGSSFVAPDGTRYTLVKGTPPGTIPKRAHAEKMQPAGNTAPTTDSTGAAPLPKPRIHLTKERVIIILFSGMVIALLLMWAATAIVNWWINVQQDWTYTANFRTYSVDQAVGHNGDSPEHPSHFIIQNDKGHILIIELPADDPKKAVLITGTTLIGADREPVTVTFQDTTGSGRLDLILHVQGQQIVCLNDGQKFNPPTG